MKLKSYAHFFRSATLASVLLVSLCANAGIFDDDEARKAILDLRQQITSLNSSLTATLNANFNTLEQKTKDEIAQMRKSLFELQNQIDRQKTDISQLRGENEVLTRNISELQIRVKDVVQVSEQKLQATEQRTQLAEQRVQAAEQRVQAAEQKVVKLEPTTINLDGKEFVADPSEKRDFDAAFGLFRSGDFTRSQKAFFDFIQRYPGSGYSPSALYWLGNAQYSNRDYKEAIINFRSMIAKTPDHMRAPEAMLSIANCQLEMKDPKAAKKTLEDLMRIYPKSEASFAGIERLLTIK
jgi:tol-pal system protein YbgF